MHVDSLILFLLICVDGFVIKAILTCELLCISNLNYLEYFAIRIQRQIKQREQEFGQNNILVLHAFNLQFINLKTVYDVLFLLRFKMY